MRRRFLHDARAAGATQLRPHRADHFEASRNVFQNLGDVFAERAQRSAAVRAAFLLRCDRFGLARQFGGKRAARRFLCRLRIHGEDRQLRGKRFGGGLVRFEVFEPQFELRDVGVHLLRPLAEVHALELEDQQIQVLDLGIVCLASTSALSDAISSESRSGSWFLRFASLLTASIPQLCHANLTMA
jgi:hypothetical protein